jgi:SAM-dependent methyltransferase
VHPAFSAPGAAVRGPTLRCNLRAAMSTPPIRLPSSLILPWPLPALAAWSGAWALWWGARTLALPPEVAFLGGLLAGGSLACAATGFRRRAIAASGFPVSALMLGTAGGLPPWVWLLLLLPLLAAYPLRAWRDAPFFPTPHDALTGLDAVVGTPQRVLDAGCGLGHGLAALHRLWPQAQLQGLEWSPLLAAAARLRCRFANVERGDMWAASWAGHDLVYLFQRPESMTRATAKAERELSPGAWLVSLEFELPGRAPVACLQGAGRRPLWVYRQGVAGLHSTAGADCR